MLIALVSLSKVTRELLDIAATSWLLISTRKTRKLQPPNKPHFNQKVAPQFNLKHLRGEKAQQLMRLLGPTWRRVHNFLSHPQRAILKFNTLAAKRELWAAMRC
jgi:hypothetical protein